MKTIVNIDPKLHVEDTESLLKLPIVIRVNDFDDENVEDFEDQMSEAHRTGQPVIPIMIHSGGGSVYGLNSMISAIEHSHVPVATIVTGTAQSAAAMLFGFGDEGYRFMDPHAHLMIHQVASEGYYSKLDDQKIDVKHTQQLNDSVFIRLAKHLGHPDRYLLDLIRKKKNTDVYLNATTAQRLRFANHLHVPSFHINVSMDCQFK